MMPRTHRLTRTAFTEVLSSSRRRTSLHFSVTFKKNEVAHSTSAAVVSKKVEKSSVGRHLLKRRMLDTIGSFSDAPFSFVLYARKGAETLSFPVLKKEITGLLSDAFAEM